MIKKQYVLNFKEFVDGFWQRSVWRFVAFDDEHAKERILTELLSEPRQRKELILGEETVETRDDITVYTQGRQHHQVTVRRNVELN